MSALLDARNLRFGYAGAAELLRSVTLTAEPGEFLAILGVNGAGKSTLLDLISGFRQMSSGVINLAGRAIAAWPAAELAQRVSHLPQAVHADLPFTAEQLVGMGRYPHTDAWFESVEDHRAVQAAMERTGCWAWRGRGFGTLSGGERQRVLLAACLAQQAEMMLLDEPSTFLDIDQQLECFSLIREETRGGRLAIAVTHDVNLALSFCSRLVVLAGGVVVRDMRVAEASADPSWLPMFSPRLRMGETGSGTPWVWYR